MLKKQAANPALIIHPTSLQASHKPTNQPTNQPTNPATSQSTN
jgi:hypothetical protein